MKYIKSIILLIITLSVLLNCARRGTPTGGPKDEDAPITIKTVPQFKSVNFNKNEIRIYFDEYVKLEDVKKNLIISPPLKYPANITPLGIPSKKIVIKLKDTLIANTTYTFNFGESIVDNNEGNVLKSFNYVFSTGNYIDSLAISGSISDSFSKESDKYVSILLYEANDQFNDSTIYKEKPLYVTNTLDSLAWNIDNLKAGKYHLLALKSDRNDYLFNPKSDKIAYLDTIISVPTEKQFKLKLFKEIIAFKPFKATEVSKGHIVFPYEGIGCDFKVALDSVKSNLKTIISKSFLEKDKDTLNYYYKTDNEIDSLFFNLTSTNYSSTEKITLRSKEIDSIIITANLRGNMTFRDTLTLQINNPLDQFNKELFSVFDKDTVAVNFKLKRKNHTELQVLFNAKENQNYKVKILPNAITDFFNQTNKDTIKYSLKTKEKDNYGSISFDFKNTNNESIIIQLLSKKEEIIATKYLNTDAAINFELLKPSVYLIRIIFDKNSNHIWDTGNYYNKNQPEKVVYFNTDIEVKENWFFKENINLDSYRNNID